ncbi:MAG: hypothetical protein R3C11_16895 [Planctomycetaceae bacterium]
MPDSQDNRLLTRHYRTAHAAARYIFLPQKVLTGCSLDQLRGYQPASYLYYGDPHTITPNLDQLATEGTRYTHAPSPRRGFVHPVAAESSRGLSIVSARITCGARLSYQVCENVSDLSSRCEVLLHE